LKVSLGTVGTLIRNHRLPHIKMGRCVRFMISDVENELKRRFKVAAHDL
jgi:excisionase family DNA binding protein